MDPRRPFLVAICLFLTPALFAQLSSDNFDSYAPGSFIAGQGDWQTWDAVPGGGGVDAQVSNLFASSAPNSLELQPMDDIVRLFNGINTGAFTFRSRVYIPSGQSGQYYFLLLNTYNHGGPYNWSCQLEINDTTGMVSDVGGSTLPLTGVSTPTPVIYDTWVTIQVDVDLIADTYDAFYNGVPIMTGNHWAGGGLSELQCLDLYNGGSGTFYYDDVFVDCQGGCGGCLPFDTMTCNIDCVTNDVTMNWSFFQLGGYANGITVLRNGTPIATLPGTATSYTDLNAPLGQLDYEVVGDCGTQTWSALCSVGCTGACPPLVLGDECCDAQPLALGANAYDNTGATLSTDDYDDAQCTGMFLGDMLSDVWFTYTAVSNGFVRFDTCGTFDTDMVVYDGQNCGSGVQIACSGDSCGLGSEVSLPATVGDVFLVRVGLWDAAVTGGAGTVNVTELCEPDFTGLSNLLDCTNGDVTLNWMPGSFDSFDVARDGFVIASGLPAGTASYTDPALITGNYNYEVTGFCATAGSSLTDTLDVVVSSAIGVTDIILRGEGAAGQVDSVAALEAALIANGISPVTLDGGPEDLACIDDPALERVWFMGGTFPDVRLLTTADAGQLATLQALGKHIYFESGDEWGFGQGTVFNDFDGVAPGSLDGDDSYTSMNGADSGFGLDTSDLVGIPYGQDQAANDWTDQIAPTSGDLLGPNSATIWSEAGGLYDSGIFYSTSFGGKIICQSWEFGGFGLDPLNPAASDALRNDLALRYLSAFGSGPPPPTEEFQRGDCNADGGVNIADAIFALGALFPGPGGPNMPQCLDACDANDDEGLNIADAISTLGVLFPSGGGPAPTFPAPGGTCGPDPTGTNLDCAINTGSC